MDLHSIDKLLTTTRSVRKRLDLTRRVEPEVIQECIEIALQAPTGSNAQGWHFMVVTDDEKRARIGDFYSKAWRIYTKRRAEPTRGQTANPEQMQRIIYSAQYLANHMGEAPVLIIPCITGRFETQPAWVQASQYGSILPAAWSLMLALRARGLGSSWTTLHLMFEKEAAAILEIPEHITQAALLPVAYYTGEDFQPAQRLPGKKLTSWNRWGNFRD